MPKFKSEVAKIKHQVLREINKLPARPTSTKKSVLNAAFAAKRVSFMP